MASLTATFQGFTLGVYPTGIEAKIAALRYTIADATEALRVATDNLAAGSGQAATVAKYAQQVEVARRQLADLEESWRRGQRPGMAPFVAYRPGQTMEQHAARYSLLKRRETRDAGQRIARIMAQRPGVAGLGANDQDTRPVMVSREIGLLMLQYHQGQRDPVYAVGSTAYAGKPSWASTVEDALYNIERDLAAVHEGRRHTGWGWQEERELRRIATALKKALRR